MRMMMIIIKGIMCTTEEIPTDVPQLLVFLPSISGATVSTSTSTTRRPGRGSWCPNTRTTSSTRGSTLLRIPQTTPEYLVTSDVSVRICRANFALINQIIRNQHNLCLLCTKTVDSYLNSAFQNVKMSVFKDVFFIFSTSP